MHGLTIPVMLYTAANPNLSSVNCVQQKSCMAVLHSPLWVCWDPTMWSGHTADTHASCGQASHAMMQSVQLWADYQQMHTLARLCCCN